MPISISYMGTKKSLAPIVREMAKDQREGPFLDLFSGMCSVGAMVSQDRQIWTNDLQQFAHAVATSHFCSNDPPPSREFAVSRVIPVLSRLRIKRYQAAGSNIVDEQKALTSGDADKICALYDAWNENDQEPGLSDYRLFERNFAGTYLGLCQAIEVDCIREALDLALRNGEISRDSHLWLILALAVAISKSATVTGHFAQALRAKRSSISRFLLQRNRPIKEGWLDAIDSLKPLRDSKWRSANYAFCGSAQDLISNMLERSELKPSVIYADPPYTADQYSRYYHLYETLVLYDYPAARGRGRYRDDRAVSNFSLKRGVENAIKNLIQGSADLDATLILSYPENGLLLNSKEAIPEIFSDAYGRVPEIMTVDHMHSTMGGSKGPGKTSVKEVLYKARFR